MNDYMENNERITPVHVFIGEEEWQNYSFQNKVRLLYRLKQSEGTLARLMEKTVSLMVDEDRKHQEIDYEATLKLCEE